MTETGYRSPNNWIPYLKAAAIFLSSRIVILLAVPFSKIYIPLGTDAWVAGPNWYHHLLRWDSEWYNLIATEGYRYNGNPNDLQTVVFYPLYPLVTRAVAAVTGLGAPAALLVVANIAALAAIVLLFKLVREECDDCIALLTVAFLSFFPGSIFLSAGYTEPLTLLLIVCFFLVLKREWFFAAAAIAGLAVAARSAGIVLLPVLLWQMWRTLNHKTFWRDAVPCIVLASSGLWLYIIYLWFAFDAPFAFSQAQAGFHKGTTMAERLIAALELQPFFKMNLTEASPAGLDGWFFLLFMVLIVRSWFRLNVDMTLFAFGVLMLPYLTLSGGPAGFISTARFNVVSFPLFLVMAELGSRVRWLVPGVIGIFGGLLFMYAALFAQWQWVG
ncbi:MAG: hypothetical protein K2X60_01050 [Xanthobacteraceae bacterium]|nr:hypothetical protein [Xanthobacteraceae bacterium]